MIESFTQNSQKNSALKIDLISVEASLTIDGSKEGNKSEKLINESNQVIQKNDDNHIANIEEVHEDVVNEVESGLPLKNVLSKELPVENEKKHNGRMDMFCIKVRFFLKLNITLDSFCRCSMYFNFFSFFSFFDYFVRRYVNYFIFKISIYLKIFGFFVRRDFLEICVTNLIN